MEYKEFTANIEPLEVGREILIAQLAEVGFESFVDTDTGVKAYIPSEEFNADMLQEISILQIDGFKVEYKIITIADQNWNKTWEENFEPILVEEQCYIRAPFHEVKPAISFEIVIDPKMSFGTGHHETTHLMVKRMLGMELTGKSLLDMGCGTAVLAILGKLKNTGYTEAIDIDEWAYQNAIENVRNNNCRDIVVKQGGAELLGGITFDVILANINRNILLADMASYVEVLRPGGDLLLSGFFSSDKPLLMEEALKNKLTLCDTEQKNDWTVLHFKKQ